MRFYDIRVVEGYKRQFQIPYTDEKRHKLYTYAANDIGKRYCIEKYYESRIKYGLLEELQKEQENFTVELKKFLYEFHSSNFFTIFFGTIPKKIPRRTLYLNLDIVSHKITIASHEKTIEKNFDFDSKHSLAEKLYIYSLQKAENPEDDIAIFQDIISFFGNPIEIYFKPKLFWNFLNLLKQHLHSEMPLYQDIDKIQKEVLKLTSHITPEDINKQTKAQEEYLHKLTEKAKEASEDLEAKGHQAVLKILEIKENKENNSQDQKNNFAADSKNFYKSPENIAKVKKIQNFWRLSTKKLLINPAHWQHPEFAEFYYFLNSVADTKQLLIFRIINQELLDQARKVLHDPEWWLQSKGKQTLIIQAAITLFARKQISRYQFYTLLMRAQVYENPPQNESVTNQRRTYKILDNKSNFTNEASSLLFPAIKNISERAGRHVEAFWLNNWFLPYFKSLLLQLPPSERIFYTSEVNFELKADSIFEEDEEQKEKEENLGYQLWITGALYSTLINFIPVIIHLSAGSQDALWLLMYGNALYPLRLRVGNLNLQAIKQGVMNSIRPGSVFPPGCPSSDTVHGDKKPKKSHVTRHDQFHQLNMSWLGRVINDVSTLGFEVIKEVTNFSMCKEQLQFVDRGFFSNFLFNKSVEERFCHFLMQSDLFFNDEITIAQSFFNITVAGIIIVLHMVENSKEWKERGINTDSLVEPLEEKIKLFTSCQEYLKDNLPIVKVFKMMLFISLGYDFNRFKPFCKQIDEDQDFPRQLFFAKRKEWELYLMKKFNIEQCKNIKGNAVILDEKNTAYFIMWNRIVMNDEKPQAVENINRQEIEPCHSIKPVKYKSSAEKKEKVIKESTFRGGHAQKLKTAYGQPNSITLIYKDAELSTSSNRPIAELLNNNHFQK